MRQTLTLQKISLAFATRFSWSAHQRRVCLRFRRPGNNIAALGVKIAPAFTPAWLYQRLVWGGLWGWLFLLPVNRAILPGAGPALQPGAQSGTASGGLSLPGPKGIIGAAVGLSDPGLHTFLQCGLGANHRLVVDNDRTPVAPAPWYSCLGSIPLPGFQRGTERTRPTVAALLV